MHVILAAYVRVISQRPAVNRFLSGQKLFARDDDIQVLLTIKRELTLEAEETIIKMNKKGTRWEWPPINPKHVTMREAIGDLPSLESGEKSDIKWHFARKHDPRHVLWMKHTKTGTSAFENEEYYPKKKDGTRTKGYQSSYRRMEWDEPAPTITMRNDAISSQRNVHPGRLLKDGTYSDARVLTPLELFILTSLPRDWGIPDDTPEILIRQVIGESIPPLMVKAIVGGIK